MARQCPICYSFNNDNADKCSTCGTPLVAPTPVAPPPAQEPEVTPEAPAEKRVTTPADQSKTSRTGDAAELQNPAQKPKPRPADRKPPDYTPVRQSPPTNPVRRQADPSQRVQVIRPQEELEGTITSKEDLGLEPPDHDIARYLFSALLIVDLVILLGSVIVGVLVGFLVLIAIAAILRANWLITIFSFLFQTIFYILNPIISLITQRRQQADVPVTQYHVVTPQGRYEKFRVKGRFAGASPAEQDRVRVWGRNLNGVLDFRGGEDLNDPRIVYRLRTNWSGLFLVLLVIANILGYLYFTGMLR